MLPSATIDDAIRVLNQALEAEPAAVRAIFGYQKLWTGALCEHPTIQVDRDSSGALRLSALGLLNGIFGTRPDGIGHICGVFDSPTADGPYTLMRFERTPIAGE